MHLTVAVRAQAEANGVLWAGSRGLAEALADGSPLQPAPRIAAVIVGISHPVTREQVRTLEGFVARVQAEGDLAPHAAKTLLIDPVEDAADEVEPRQALLGALGRLPLAGDQDGGLIVVAGDTLSNVLEATETDGLEVLGEVGPGTPIVRVRGGRLDGRSMMTKSGGFDSPGLLLNLLARGWPTPDDL